MRHRWQLPKMACAYVLYTGGHNACSSCIRQLITVWKRQPSLLSPIHPPEGERAAWLQDEQAVYLQLDLVPGGDLCTLLQRAGPLTEATVARFTRQILETLLYLHDTQGPSVHVAQPAPLPRSRRLQ